MRHGAEKGLMMSRPRFSPRARKGREASLALSRRMPIWKGLVIDIQTRPDRRNLVRDRLARGLKATVGGSPTERSFRAAHSHAPTDCAACAGLLEPPAMHSCCVGKLAQSSVRRGVACFGCTTLPLPGRPPRRRKQSAALTRTTSLLDDDRLLPPTEPSAAIQADPPNMSVLLETSAGDITIDLLVDDAPTCCEK